MTTRKHFAALAGAGALLLALAFSGCATPGVLHVYAIETPSGARVRDTGQPATADVKSFLEDGEQLTGFAYDPFTDHFFLRLAPGNRLRVVDRPARAIKREFVVEGLAADGRGGDLAIRPRDGHVFFLQPGASAIMETSRLGKRVREFALAGVSGATGLAYDARDNRLFALHADGREISFHDTDGQRLGGVTLDRAVAASLAFDEETREFYAPLRETRGAIGVFGADGRLVRTLEPSGAAFVDVGPRSFVRVF